MDGDAHVQTAVTEISILVIYHFFVELFRNFFKELKKKIDHLSTRAGWAFKVEVSYKTFSINHCKPEITSVSLKKSTVWVKKVAILLVYYIYLLYAFCLMSLNPIWNQPSLLHFHIQRSFSWIDCNISWWGTQKLCTMPLISTLLSAATKIIARRLYG